MIKQIKVGGVVYPVVEKENIIIDGDADFLGSCDYKDHIIELRSDTGQARKEQTLVHELVHAMLFESGYGDHDEELVKRLGKMLHQVLQDNDFGFLRNYERVWSSHLTNSLVNKRKASK